MPPLGSFSFSLFFRSRLLFRLPSGRRRFSHCYYYYYYYYCYCCYYYDHHHFFSLVSFYCCTWHSRATPSLPLSSKGSKWT